MTVYDYICVFHTSVSECERDCVCVHECGRIHETACVLEYACVRVYVNEHGCEHVSVWMDV